MDKLYTSKEVGEITGLAHSTVRDYAVLLNVGEKIAGRWVFTDSDIFVIENRSCRRGRPKMGETRVPIRK